MFYGRTVNKVWAGLEFVSLVEFRCFDRGWRSAARCVAYLRVHDTLGLN